MHCRKIVILSVLILLCGHTLFAQDTLRKQVYYKTKTIRNEPGKVANLHVGIIPVFLDANNLNLAMGCGLEATYLYKNLIALGGRYQYAYADRKEEESAFNTLGVCASGTSPYRNLDLNATYYFSNDTSPKNENIFLGREKLDADFVDFYLEVKAKRMRLFGFRGGFMAYKSFIRDNEGTIGFKGHLITEPDSRVLDMVGEYSTMMETNNYYLGVSCLEISDWLAEVEKYGIKEYRRRTELYADIIYSPAILYYNITAHGTQNSISFREYNVNEYTSRSRFGARFGFTRWSLKKAGIGYGIEAGVRPGPSAGLMYNSYISLRGSLNIAKRI